LAAALDVVVHDLRRVLLEEPVDPGGSATSRVELAGSNRPEFCAASTARGLSHEKRSLRRPIMSGTSVAALCGMGLLSLLGSVFAILLVGETHRESAERAFLFAS